MLGFPIGECQICGCTENDACTDGETACTWVNEQHDLCSFCSDIEVTWKRVPTDKFLKKIKESEY